MASFMIQRKGNDYVLTIPAHLISENHVRRLVEWLTFEQLRQKNQMKESEAWKLSEAIKDDWWKENRERILSKLF